MKYLIFGIILCLLCSCTTESDKIQLQDSVFLSASSIDGEYDSLWISIFDGTGEGQKRLILEYDGVTKISIVDKNWEENPDETSEYYIYSIDSSQIVIKYVFHTIYHTHCRMCAWEKIIYDRGAAFYWEGRIEVSYKKPTLDFGSILGEINVYIQCDNCSFVLSNMDSDDIVTFEGNGDLVIDSTCTDANIIINGITCVLDKGWMSNIIKGNKK